MDAATAVISLPFVNRSSGAQKTTGRHREAPNHRGSAGRGGGGVVGHTGPGPYPSSPPAAPTLAAGMKTEEAPSCLQQATPVLGFGECGETGNGYHAPGSGRRGDPQPPQPGLLRQHPWLAAPSSSSLGCSGGVSACPQVAAGPAGPARCCPFSPNP